MASEEVPKVKLYWLEKSRAQNILWLLEELKIDYELETFHRLPSMMAPPELKKIHPLGKSPLISVKNPVSGEPIVMAESGFIVQYLSEHFGRDTTMMPTRYKPGQEGKVGGETEAWLRWQYILHFTEGTFFATLLLALILSNIKGPRVPFFIRPVTSLVANQIFSSFVQPNIRAQFEMLEGFLETSGGDYLCGKDLSSADVLLSFGLMSSKDEVGKFGDWEGRPPKQRYPKLFAYVDRLERLPGFKRSVDKIKAIDESFGVTGKFD